MAFRKFRRSFRRSFSRRRRGVRLITEPRRWEAASFYVNWEVSPSAGTSEGIVLDIVSQAHFDDFGLDTQATSLANALRTVEVGGLVWDTLFLSSVPGGAQGGVFPVQEILWTDRLDDTGAPAVGLTTDWWAIQSPIQVGASDDDYPVRIHSRRAAGIWLPGTNDFQGGILTSTQTAAAPFQPQNWSTRSVRLRGGLGDRQGLFLQLTMNNDTEDNEIVRGAWAGTLYYRARM